MWDFTAGIAYATAQMARERPGDPVLGWRWREVGAALRLRLRLRGVDWDQEMVSLMESERRADAD